jgi:hypothetical protein
MGFSAADSSNSIYFAFGYLKAQDADTIGAMR